VAVGFVIVWKTEAVVSFTGYSNWAESKLGTMGGTRTMYKLIGLLLIFFGMLAIFNLYEAFLNGTIGAVFSTRL